jgi:prophage regulatory protein
MHENPCVILDLIGAAEIADLLGISRQRVHQLASTDATFPRPVAELSAGKIWLKADVAAWAAASGRCFETN